MTACSNGNVSVVIDMGTQRAFVPISNYFVRAVELYLMNMFRAAFLIKNKLSKNNNLNSKDRNRPEKQTLFMLIVGCLWAQGRSPNCLC
jgi:hypothetical protein